MRRDAFTLLEIIITVAIIGIIAVTLLVLINPWQQIDKAHDAKRKSDLAILQRSFEEYYNDKGCYPQADHVCYDTPQNVCGISKTVTAKLCNICGSEAKPPLYSEIEGYIPELPCDPQHPSKNYLYQVERPGCARNDSEVCAENCSSSTYCPQWYRIYSELGVVSDSDSNALGCQGGGCGPPQLTPPYGYDYGVASHQVGLERSNGYVCISSNSCNACQSPRDYEACVSDPGCPDENKIYGTVESCCASSPKPANCP